MRLSTVAAVLSSTLGLVPQVSLAQNGQDVPPTLALTVMLKVLTYDSSFAERGSGEFVVLVPFAPKEEAAAHKAVAAGEAVEQKSILGRPLRFVAVALAELPTRVDGAAAILAHERTNAEQAKAIARAAGRLYLLALDPALVEDAFQLSVGTNAGRAQVVVNVRAARAAGVDLKTSVLKLARTVQ